MATRAEPVPAPADWRRHGFASWLAATDHKRIGILHIWTSLVFLVVGGFLALLMQGAEADAAIKIGRAAAGR